MSSAARTPPRYVPTLTEVVHMAVPLAPSVPDEVALPEAAQPESFSAMQEQIIYRVMQRVDVLIEQRLIEAVSNLLLQHTKSLEPRLREEIEFVVRQSVTEAVAEELAIGNPAGM